MAWKSPSTAAERRAFLGQVDALREKDPDLAEQLIESARLSLRRSERSQDWVEPEDFNVHSAGAAN